MACFSGRRFRVFQVPSDSSLRATNLSGNINNIRTLLAHLLYHVKVLMSMFGQDETLFSGVLRYTSVFDLTCHPTLTLPCGRTAAGAPIAFQLVAPHFGETALIQSGWAWQQVTDWHRTHPAL
ncbi:hypothetical protein [Klebsiella pneumoniae]|uniref:hypothetical protein n=1 Tax=Klebsiella pneumoniae TaxID=573 RepID=UPI00209B495C|nr:MULTISPECIES: hypothetical protein [Klebsiella]MDK1978400.1 hypothetical protein [Klebsiella sp. K4-154]MEA4301733.1 hypothetical protein [Klebsiella pneumoniae]